jgi:hypothetical protein
MPKLPFFVATCPSCSRKSQIEIRWLGCRTDCVFCGKTYQATGTDSSSAALEDPLHYWINFTAHCILEQDEFTGAPKDIARTPR